MFFMAWDQQVNGLIAVRATHETGLRNNVRIRNSLLGFVFSAHVREVILRGRKKEIAPLSDDLIKACPKLLLAPAQIDGSKCPATAV